MKSSPLLTLHSAIQQAVARRGEAATAGMSGSGKVGNFLVEHPADTTHGDYATNAAMVLWKQQGAASPRKFADELVLELKKDETLKEFVENISVAGPGFINFSLKKKWLIDALPEVLENPHTYGNGTALEDKKILVEFTDPNPFKEFHIGHLMSNTFGEALARLLEVSGADVVRLCYQGDVGMHIAKAVWGWKKALADGSVKMADLEAATFTEKANWLGKFYAAGAKAYEESEDLKAEMNTINAHIYKATDPEISLLYSTGRQWSLAYFEKIYQTLGTQFDHYYFESVVGPIGQKLVEEWLEKGLFEKSQGAVIFPGEKYGLHTRVFLNSLGLPTYEAKELGLADTKRKDYEFVQSIVVTGNEIQEYFKVLMKAMSLIMPDVAAKTVHVPHGMLKLTTGKMSSRTGNVITGRSLLDDLTASALEKVQAADRAKISADEQHTIAENVAVAAFKFTVLKQGIGRDIIFNPTESISFEGDTGPYVQYTYARAKSVLEKSGEKKVSKVAQANINDAELSVLRLLVMFPEVVQRAAHDLSPNDLCVYLLQLSQAFNSFYAENKVVGSENEAFRLQLTKAVSVVLQRGLHCLGIRVVERM